MDAVKRTVEISNAPGAVYFQVVKRSGELALGLGFFLLCHASFDDDPVLDDDRVSRDHERRQASLQDYGSMNVKAQKDGDKEDSE